MVVRGALATPVPRPPASGGPADGQPSEPARSRSRRWAGALTLLCSWVLASCGGAPRPPDVLLIVLDTLRTEHLSLDGYERPTSPHLDALAARGAWFRDCTAQASWTLPSMVSMLTGQPVFETLYELPDGHLTLAERFAAAGYRTGAVLANSALAADRGFARGVDEYRVRELSTGRWWGSQVTDEALAFLDADDGRPRFLWLQYMDTHRPYEPPSVPWQGDYSRVFDGWERSQIEAVLDELPEDQRAQLAAQRPELSDAVDRYDGALAELDRQVGRLLAGLEQRGLAAGTLVMVVSDHGETLYRRREHPDRLARRLEFRERKQLPLLLGDLLKSGHADWVYQELVRVPWIVAGPGVLPGQVRTSMVSNLDVAPTLLGLAGLPVPDLPGRDLSARLRDGGPVPSAPFVTSSSDSALTLRLPDGTKLIDPAPAPAAAHGLVPERFDLVVDPLERAPRSAGDSASLELLERLRAAALASPFRERAGEGLDAETLERLSELGYLR